MWTWTSGTGSGTGRDSFVAERLPGVAESFAGRDDAPACLVQVIGTGQVFRIGPAAAGGARPGCPGRRGRCWPG